MRSRNAESQVPPPPDSVSLRNRAADYEAALRQVAETENRFRTLADSAPVLLWMAGKDALCDFFNQGWLSFTGRSLEQELGNGWAEGVHPEDFSRALQIYMDAFVARRSFAMEYRLRRFDGEYRWIYDQGAPRFDGGGLFAGFIGSCVDVTAQRQARDTLRQLNAVLEERVRERTALANQRAMLLREVHHRVKNDLQLICSLLSIQGRELENATAAEAFDDCVMRVQAIAQIHEHMYRSENLAQMSFSEHLRSLTSQVGQLARSPNVDFELELADQLILKVDRAIPCAMIVHELVVNAFKHAFPGSRRGRVRVTCARESATLVKVVVEDDGIGLPERSGETSDGLGWTLIVALTRQLRGTLNIRRSPGTRVELCFSDELSAAAPVHVMSEHSVREHVVAEQVGSRSESRNSAEVGA